ncbi:Protein-glutamate O-methyltransferase, partial [Armadillidium nasatum]
MLNNPLPLSGSKEGSFPYLTLRDRLPIILTRIVDQLCREKKSICEEYGEGSAEEIKSVVGRLSELKNELQTNKPFKTLIASKSNNPKFDDDVNYNTAIESYRKSYKADPKWFEVAWLFAECYFYKRIDNSFKSSNLLSSYDPFKIQKIKACEDVQESIEFLSQRTVKDISSLPSQDEMKKIVFEMVEISLWGNQYDLSIASGETLSQESIVTRLSSLRENIIACDLESFWDFLIKLPENKKHIAFVSDNAGLELFADLCLASLLTEYKLVNNVTFYPKTRPWYVSDTLRCDIKWTLDYLTGFKGDVKEMGQRIKNYFEEGTWDIKENKFWTTHHDYSEMKKVDPELYNELGTYSFVIFKGDLNYRKLFGDLDWPNNTSLRTALRGFQPSPLLILRTIKGGPTVGLDESSAKVINAKLNEDWNISGKIGLIHFTTHQRDLNFFMTVLLSSTAIVLIAYLCRS